MTLSDLCEIKHNFKDADFWIIDSSLRTSETKVGTPVKEYKPEYIGVKVIKKDILVPEYCYYMIEYLKNTGVFDQHSTGTVLKKITPALIGSISLVQP